jgi:SAM-dependent methyltransferase
MSKEESIIDFLKQNIKGRPSRAIDVCCGTGGFVNYLTSNYPIDEVCGLDIDRQALARGIARGYFKKAVPIHGDAYELKEEHPRLTEVSLDPEYHKNVDYEWMNLKHEKLKKPLKNFDLSVTVNPWNRLTSNDINNYLMSGTPSFRPIPVSIISSPVKRGGFVLYETEIVNKDAGIYGGPTKVDEELIKKSLASREKQGKDAGLDFIDYRLVGDDYSTDLAVLFKKI